MPSTKTPQVPDPFESYPKGSALDAVFAENGGVKSGYGPVVDVLQTCTKADLNQRQKRLDRAVDELGLHFSDSEHSSSRFNPWRLDLFPLVLEPDEWKRIERGVVQRALAFNAYATDLYSEQAILKQRVIPHDLVLRDPAFLRQLSGIEVPGGEYSQFGALDLVNHGDGDWKVVEHHMGTPFGMSHVLQNRRILSQVFPELYENADIAPVAGFSTYLLEMLRAQSARSNPHVLLLTSGLPGQAYFEEAFLARHMGISIAQPRDLLVRESRVFLKTIRGLERVDVIYRRVESSALDPIAMANLNMGGVPGLINVVRKGNVAIVNAPGAGVLDNRALLRYSDRIVSHYLSESPILKSVETFHLSDVDQRAYVAENEDSMILKPVQDHDIIWRHCGGKRPTGSNASMDGIARKYPQYFVAQKIPEPNHLPRYRNGRFSAEGVYLRVYFILGKTPLILPGGMARQTPVTQRTRRLTITTDGLKDVWVPDSVVEDSAPKRLPARTGERFSIGSRVAESLYWAGRYLERAENTARQFNTLEKLRWDQMAQSEQQTYWPLFQAVAAATGQSDILKRKKPPRDTVQFSRSLLLDAAKGASVHACIVYARNSLEKVRETISPECREVVEEMILFLTGEAKRRTQRSRLLQVSETIVSEVARFNGTAERTMPHDDSWQFYRVGVFIERAMGTLSLLEVALPRIVRSYQAMDEESADLTALLRLLGSLDAYRREFRSRAYVDRVARLIIQGNSNPSSVCFCLRNLHYAIGTLLAQGDRVMGQELLRELHETIDGLSRLTVASERHSHVDLLDDGALAAAVTDNMTPKEVSEELTALTKQVEGLHERIEDVFFSHQDVFARDPLLFDLE